MQSGMFESDRTDREQARSYLKQQADFWAANTSGSFVTFGGQTLLNPIKPAREAECLVTMLLECRLEPRYLPEQGSDPVSDSERCLKYTQPNHPNSLAFIGVHPRLKTKHNPITL